MTLLVKIENQDEETSSVTDGKQRVVKVSRSENDGAPAEIDTLFPGSVCSHHVWKGSRLVVEEIFIDAPAPKAE